MYPFGHLFIQHTITKFLLCTRSVLGVRFSENENTVPVSKQPEVWTTLVKMCITPPSAIHRMALTGCVWCVRCCAGAGLTVQKMESLHTHNHSDLHKAGTKDELRIPEGQSLRPSRIHTAHWFSNNPVWVLGIEYRCFIKYSSSLQLY